MVRSQPYWPVNSFRRLAVVYLCLVVTAKDHKQISLSALHLLRYEGERVSLPPFGPHFCCRSVPCPFVEHRYLLLFPPVAVVFQPHPYTVIHILSRICLAALQHSQVQIDHVRHSLQPPSLRPPNPKISTT